MVLESSLRFLVVFGGSGWFLDVLGSWRFLVVLGGSGCFLIVLGDSWR